MTTANSTPTDNAQQNSKYFRKALNDLTPNNIGQLKEVNKVLLGDELGQAVYDDALKVGDFAKLALFNDIIVGGIITAKSTVAEAKKNKVEIVSLAVLPAYQKLGLGTMLLDHIINTSETQLAGSEIHVRIPTKDTAAVSFFTKRGFAASGDPKSDTQMFVRTI
ncbi:uncharacterized protein EV422DRAFT_100564 [Fimicolochytrium jonesii]|uniref:uncharacterized protein n=1 Tax=Fimicolochytrium jonesii TaxID=1396493 RepID=UPI0022FE1769|nr:uncharacterized protein EV422DRAFT_100564 [Fimicolochytrium jonesii]KAI8819642.1 hypothetical protein EV422DRAFT_100564 [Fimicolochytrium jonesii]